ncbi:MAG: response regulator [Spirochaetia bacterium]|nr:response regulator [Spirochaetia bacterium]MCE1209793.1 response regulator [Spirochaetia bacterium]
MGEVTALGGGFFWVGNSLLTENLICNPYLLVEGGEGILFDPGSTLDAKDVMASVASILPLDKIRYVVLHHQDPDLAAALPYMEAADMKFTIVTHWRTWSLLRFYGITSPVYLVDEHGYALRLSSGRTLQFIPTPYLHFPGAIATYDRQSKFLLSSDLFGAFSERWSLYADDGYREAMKRFHEHYMPSNEILRPTMDLISCLELEAILPQHGSIIKENIPSYIDTLKNLECGLALESGLRGEKTKPDYQALGEEVTRLKELNEQLQKAATLVNEVQMRDSTTGLYDETFFKEFIDEQASLRFYAEGVEDDVLAVFGIDEGMARIEYQYGPKEVEAILKGVARILQDGKAATQPVFRLHGTTFALWMPRIVFHKAVELCETIRTSVEASKSFIERITVSAGLVAVAEIRSTILDPAEAGATLAEAGVKRLRIARKRGGNTICTSSEVGTETQSRAKILVVDDNQIHAGVLKTFLENNDYTVSIAQDGGKALSMVAEEGFDLIISELMVPKVDGFMLKDSLAAKSGTKDIPFILVSHRKNENSVRRAYGQGVDHYLQKPYLMAELLGIVHNMTSGGGL